MPGGILLAILHPGQETAMASRIVFPLPELDRAFRPATYFPKDAAPPPAKLPDEIRTAIGRIHPSLMGGLYLPDFLPGEVEVVRIQLASVTADVISVRARPAKKRIAFRIVDEYGHEGESVYTCRPCTSTRPLTQGEIVALIDDATDDGGIAMGAVQWNAGNGSDIDDLRGFITITSPFYPQLGAWYAGRVDAFLDSQLPEEEDEEEGGAHESAR